MTANPIVERLRFDRDEAVQQVAALRAENAKLRAALTDAKQFLGRWGNITGAERIIARAKEALNPPKEEKQG